MQKIKIPCSFRGGAKSEVEFYVGSPQDGKHPIGHQAHWLSKERGGTVPEGVMDSIREIQNLSKENEVPFEQLFEHAWNSSNQQTIETPNPNESKEQIDGNEHSAEKVTKKQLGSL